MGRALLALLFAGVIVAACGDEDAESSGGGGTGGTASTDAAPDTSNDVQSDTADSGGGTLGAQCGSDTDCVQGLSCWHDDGVEDRYPAHGLCTVACEDDATCSSLSLGAKCVLPWSGATPGSKRCVEACKAKTPGFSSATAGMPADKCHGRNDMACYEGRCGPRCNDDSACSTGKCSAKTGYCHTGQVETWTDNLGQPVSSNFECPAGLITNSTATVCTPACTLGVVPSCGWKGPGTAAAAACLPALGGGQGDLGMCLALCDCDSDCTAPLKCVALSSGVQQATERKGYCWMGQQSLTCADAGADASDGDVDAADAAADAASGD